MELEDFQSEFRTIIQRRANFTSPPENPPVLHAAKELDNTLQAILTTARDSLFQIEKDRDNLIPQKETLQIIVGTTIEALNTLKEFHRNLRAYRTQSQLIKGLTQLLDWTSELDYALDNARTLLRRTQKVVTQIERLDILSI